MNIRIINILNGQCMYDYFIKNDIEYKGKIIPFNEAMCVGTVSEIIFSEEFIENRCKTHNVSRLDYEKITLNYLESFIKLDFDLINLWFDEDMFCQINMLTILAYIDYSGYKGEVLLNLVDGKFEVIDKIKISLDNVRYYEVYKNIMINKNYLNNLELKTLKEGINLYLEFIKENNEITNFIRENKDCTVIDLLNKFSKYGLGDTQYKELINRVRCSKSKNNHSEIIL